MAPLSEENTIALKSTVDSPRLPFDDSALGRRRAQHANNTLTLTLFKIDLDVELLEVRSGMPLWLKSRVQPRRLAKRSALPSAARKELIEEAVFIFHSP